MILNVVGITGHASEPQPDGTGATIAGRIGNPLWRLARDHNFRSRSACNGRRYENRKIGVAARESIEADLAIPYDCKLTAQETRRGTMLGRRPLSVDNADARA